MITKEQTIQNNVYENEILELIDNRDEYTRSDLQGIAQSVSEFVAALQGLTEQDQPIATTAIATTMRPKKLNHRAPVTKSTKFRIKKWMGEHH